MAGPLNGIRVVEMSTWGALPGGGAILADWGAEVIKVEEPSGGDPARAFGMVQASDTSPKLAPIWEQDNRNKKSVTIDVSCQEGQAALKKLLATADVFVTSSRPNTLERLGLAYHQLAGELPRLVFLHLSGFGPKGPDSERPGYDALCFWSRSGLALSLAEPAADFPTGQRPALGDHTTSIAIAGGVAAALFARERTGRGQMVQTALFHTGLWVSSVDLVAARVTKRDVRKMGRHMSNPLTCTYRTADGFVHLVNLQGDRFWPSLCRAVQRPDLITDPRYRSVEARAQNNRAIIELLDQEFALRTTREWAERFDKEGVRWGKVQTVLEATEDEQAAANGYFETVDHPDAGSLTLVTSPVQFSESPRAIRAPAPQLGQHTEELLLSLGYGWDEITTLKNKGIIL